MALIELSSCPVYHSWNGPSFSTQTVLTDVSTGSLSLVPRAHTAGLDCTVCAAARRPSAIWSCHTPDDCSDWPERVNMSPGFSVCVCVRACVRV